MAAAVMSRRVVISVTRAEDGYRVPVRHHMEATATAVACDTADDVAYYVRMRLPALLLPGDAIEFHGEVVHSQADAMRALYAFLERLDA